MLDLPILDAHVHVWDPRTTPRTVTPAVRLFGFSPTLLGRLAPVLFPRAALAFVGSPRYVLAPFMPADHRQEHGSADVRGFIHIEAAWKRRNPMRFVEETEWLESLGDPGLRGIVGQADLAHPQLDALLDAHAAASPRFVGVRDKVAFSPDPGVMSWCKDGSRMANPAWRRGFARLGERGLTFDAWCYAEQLPDLIDLVRAVPGTRVVLDHLGTPVDLFASGGRSGSDPAWHDDLARLAEHPQVHAKISGMLMPVLGAGLHKFEQLASVDEVVDRLGPHVAHALRVFGPGRCIFASNFPMDRVSVTWATLYAGYDQLTAGLSRPEREAAFQGNAISFYRLPTPSP